jgi:predicted Zn-dependent protease
MLEDIIAVLKASEADAWEVTDTKTHGWEFYFIRHALDQNRAKNVEHIHVTVYKKIEDGKYLGNAGAEIQSSESKEEVEKIIHDLIYRASLVKNPAYALRQPVEAEGQNASADVSAVAEDFINVMNDMPETKSEDINSYEIFANVIERRFLNSNGIDHTETYPSSMLEVVTNARNEKQEIELYRLYHMGTCDQEGLKKDVSRTLQYGKDRLNTVSTPALGSIPVVFSTADAKTITDYFVNRLNAQYVYRKMSDWKTGTPIAEDVRGDRVSVKALKSLPNSSANLAYDSEGAPVRDLVLMENNVPVHYWGNAMFSSYMHLSDTFNVSNYEVTGGSRSEEEIRSGRYLEVVEFSDFQVSAVTGDIFGEIRLGYLHDGDSVKIVSGGSVSGSMSDYVKNLELSKESTQYNNARIPALIRLNDVTVTGAE